MQLKRALTRFANLFRRDRAERELEREMTAHLALIEDEYLRRGLNPKEAKRKARQTFGNAAAAKEDVRDMWSWASIERLRQDAGYGVRGLRKNPGFALMAIMTLALGISVNTTIFSAVDAIVLHPLPYPQPDRLIRVWSSMLKAGFPHASSTLPDYHELRSKNRTLAGIAAYTSADYNLTGEGPPIRLHGASTTASFFNVFGVKPIAGNPYDEEAEKWGEHRVVVLSEPLWRRQFGSDRTIVGRAIMLDGQAYQVLGVMPASFNYPDGGVQLWTPISYAPQDPMNTRVSAYFDMVARLKSGVTLAQTRAELDALMPQINSAIGGSAESLQESIVGDIRPTMLLLLGAVGLVMLVACTNVANLLLARASARQKEISVRSALGAGRLRLMQQMLTESVLLAAIGGACGLLLSIAFRQMIRSWAPQNIPRLDEVALNGQVLLFTAGLSLLTGLGFGVAPAIAASRTDLGDALKDGTRGASSSLRKAGARSMLVVVEISLCLALVIGGGLLVLSLLRLQQVDPGFHPQNVLTFRIDLPKTGYAQPKQAWTFADDLIGRLRTIPGVEAAGATSVLPFASGASGRLLTIVGRPTPGSFAEVPIVNFREVSADYLHAVGANIERGRSFTSYDGPGQPGAVMINETLAKRFWPDSDPIGAKLYPGPPEELIQAPPGTFPRLTVVGVVADLRDYELDAEPRPALFVPYSQAGPQTANSIYFVTRTAGQVLSSEPVIDSAVHAIDPNLPVSDVRTMEDRVSDSLSTRRFTMWLLCLFAISALALAAVGTYGVISYSVSQRRQEMGIRIALGATAREIIGSVLRQAGVLALIGTGIGVILGAILAQLSRAFLFGVKANDPAVYVGAAVLLFVTTLAASYVPARRASRSDPMTALRNE